jgi:hypothetical protein
MGKLGNDRKPEPRARHALVKPPAALDRDPPELFGQPWAIVLNDQLKAASRRRGRTRL